MGLMDKIPGADKMKDKANDLMDKVPDVPGDIDDKVKDAVSKVTDKDDEGEE